MGFMDPKTKPKRDRRFMVRLSEAEWTALMAMAEADHRTPSDFIRLVIFGPKKATSRGRAA